MKKLVKLTKLRLRPQPCWLKKSDVALLSHLCEKSIPTNQKQGYKND